MPHPFVIAIPRPACIGLVGGNVGVAVLQVDDGIGTMRDGGNLHPEIDCPCRGVVAFTLEGQEVGSCGVGGEEDIIAVCVDDIAAVGDCCQVGVCAGEQHGKAA